MVLVRLCKREEVAIFMKTTVEELRLFSTQEKAEAWLRVNGFVYRPRTFFKGDPLCWCHENEDVINFRVKRPFARTFRAIETEK